jgi:sec-independent protein translocase protein TatC
MPLSPDSEKPRLHEGLTPDGLPEPVSDSVAETGGALVRQSSTTTVAQSRDDGHDDPSRGGGSGGEPPLSGGGSGSGGSEPGDLRRMSFLDHLEELRQRIIRSLIAVSIGFGVCWVYRDAIYAGLSHPVVGALRDLHLDDQLVYTNPVAIFTLYVRLAMIAGVFVASPYVLWQVWGFISPGLYPHEKRYAVPFTVFCSGLFIAGGAFAYFVAFPAALHFLLEFSHQFKPMITADEYFSLATTIIIGMALVFELPVLLLVLTLLRLATPGFLFRNTRYAILLIFIVAAVVTPTPDIPNMMLFALPLTALYFVGIGLSYIVVRTRRRRQES